ncbi:MAG: calcium/sodium antiporter [Aquificae bacterium]|nr:calcium/sodium antiporter [Aquificota bacterium]
MLADFLLLAVGLLFLVKGADLLIDGASALARRLGIPEFVIGLTLVAFGTSLPELTVNVTASLKGASEISLGNVVGSNIANILLILGVASLIRPLSVHATFVKKEIPVNFFLTLTLIVMANDVILNNDPVSVISRGEGLVLIITFIGYMYFLVAYLERRNANGEGELIHPLKALGFLVVGLVGLKLGADWTVEGAVGLAKSLGVSEAVIGLFMIAIGTSLPELFTSAVSAYRGNPDIALGNVAGSNIFNVTLVLGTSSVINAVPVPQRANIDFAVLFVATLLLLLSVMVGRRKYVIDRWEGAVFLIAYTLYVVVSWYYELT